ncbi:AzlD domain-containing protein [Halorarius litoreus]|uniref:AzlD domain-containing protein n=1 Tax=Halorarius litoreus TaxID=2962676 RepID=UPI0020CE1965|nr:AzlD domain-containing protein [Halorarius litoreus]
MTASDLVIWTAIVLGGLGTFAIRASFIFLYERFDVPPRAERLLRLVPAAVLAALVVPAFLTVEGTPVVETGLGPVAALGELFGSDRLLAGIVAAVVAWYTEDILATIVAGMVALLLLGSI